jgi:uncharacterized protein (TIGR02001 family)
MMQKHVLVAAALACTWAGASQALEVTANGGFMSEYVFRGILQKESSAYGGLDLGLNGFYLGTWAADVGEGLEVDLYGGYAGELGDFSYGIGATGYFYTDDFDDTYRELNLSAGWKILTLDAAFGEYENFDEPKERYTFLSATVEHLGFFGTLGSFSRDFDGEYVEVGYGNTFEPIGVDYTLSFIHSNKDLLGEAKDSTIVLSIGKSFTIR